MKRACKESVSRPTQSKLPNCRSKDTSAETISDIRSMRARGATLAEVAIGGNAARVVDASRLVNLLGARGRQVVEDLLQALARRKVVSTVRVSKRF